MSVAGPGTPIVADDARAVRNWVRHTALPYGEVRVGPGEIAVGVESLPHVTPVQRALYEQAIAAAGVDPDNVLVVCITEASIEVDALDPDDAQWPVRTQRVAPANLPQRAGHHGLRAPVSIDGIGRARALSTTTARRHLRPEHYAPK